jgi:hypothetical protein
MDPLSLTASIIAVVQVSHAVLVCCYRIRGRIKDAEGDISSIISNLETLTDILEELRELIPLEDAERHMEEVSLTDGTSVKSSEPRSAHTACMSSLKACQDVLEELLLKLEPLSRPGLRNKLRWPLESSNVQRKLGIIDKHKSTLQLALTTYQTRVITQQSKQLNTVEDRKRRAEVLNWYKTSDPEQNHKVSRDRHEPNTSTWIFKDEDFHRWKEASGPRTLWLHGIPGAGKTILCSSIIAHMLELHQSVDNMTKVAYYYFDFSDNNKQSLVGLLKSTIYQLISTDDGLSIGAEQLYESKNEGAEAPTTEELLSLLLEEVSRTKMTYLIIDALDECSEDERELFFGEFLQKPLVENLAVLLTSRKEPDIERCMKEVDCETLCIQNSLVDADVRTHVTNAIARDSRLQKWKAALRQEILDSIVNGAHGM